MRAKTNRLRALKGFNLIELVIAIVVIGILSKVVIAKYMGFSTTARLSAVKNLTAIVISAKNDAQARCIATSGCYGNGITFQLTINGVSYQMVNGYPASGDNGGTEIDQLVAAPAIFTIIKESPWTYWQLSSAPSPANCYVAYEAASSSAVPPLIVSATTGC